MDWTETEPCGAQRWKYSNWQIEKPNSHRQRRFNSTALCWCEWNKKIADIGNGIQLQLSTNWCVGFDVYVFIIRCDYKSNSIHLHIVWPNNTVNNRNNVELLFVEIVVACLCNNDRNGHSDQHYMCSMQFFHYCIALSTHVTIDNSCVLTNKTKFAVARFQNSHLTFMFKWIYHSELTQYNKHYIPVYSVWLFFFLSALFLLLVLHRYVRFSVFAAVGFFFLVTRPCVCWLFYFFCCFR